MIYVDQLGYLPKSKKIAVLAQENDTQRLEDKCVRVLNEDGICIMEKKAVYFGYDEASEDFIWQVDFTELEQPGIYRLEDEQGTLSYHFRIGADLYEGLNKILCKAFYYQRCGMELEERHAGIFKRKSCHEKEALLLEDYERFRQGEKNVMWYDVKGGWHDAGDYGRYTTGAATALAHLLYAWDDFSDSFKMNLNIPESENGVDDILNECLYELKWLLKMQMSDGSVCHKLTSMRHANFVMPCEDKRQMILFPASTMATGAFAGIMAKASRVYRDIDIPFADKAFEAAVKAWNWLELHPELIGFQNPKGCNTGEYGDQEDADERIWAAVELFKCTGESAYLEKVEGLLAAIDNKSGFGWLNVSGFAGWALLDNQLKSTQDSGLEPAISKRNTGNLEIHEKESLKSNVMEEQLQNQYRQIILMEASKVLEISKQCGYMVAMKKEEYHWGSNATPLNRGMLLATAYLLSGEKSFLECVEQQLHYILGVNATGYSYVTGMGENACRYLHNRVTVADEIEEMIPGFISGGANGHPADEKAEWMIAPGTPPMKCFLDIWECYSLNEHTIYWNSPAVFIVAFLEHVYSAEQ